MTECLRSPDIFRIFPERGISATGTDDRFSCALVTLLTPDSGLEAVVIKKAFKVPSPEVINTNPSISVILGDEVVTSAFFRLRETRRLAVAEQNPRVRLISVKPREYDRSLLVAYACLSGFLDLTFRPYPPTTPDPTTVQALRLEQNDLALVLGSTPHTAKPEKLKIGGYKRGKTQPTKEIPGSYLLAPIFITKN